MNRMIRLLCATLFVAAGLAATAGSADAEIGLQADLNGFSFGDYDNDVAHFDVDGFFPSAFSNLASSGTDLRYGNTSFACSAAMTAAGCSRQTAKSVWLYKIDPFDTVPAHGTITISGPAGTVLPTDPGAYAVAGSCIELVGLCDESADTPESIERIAANKVQLSLSSSRDGGSDGANLELYVWVAQVQNPSARTYAKETITATTSINGDNRAATAPDDVTIDNASAVVPNSSLVASPTTATVGLSNGPRVTATLRDPYGNGVGGKKLLILDTSGGASDPGDPPDKTSANGTYAESFTSTQAGSSTFTAYYGDDTLPDNPTVTFRAAAPIVPPSTISTSETQVIADGNQSAVVTVKLGDVYGNADAKDEIRLVPDRPTGTQVFQNGTITPVSTPFDFRCDPPASLPEFACANEIDTITQGGQDIQVAVAKFLVTNSSAEAVKFSAQDLSTGAQIVDASVTITFVAGTPDTTKSTITPISQDGIADGSTAAPITVTLRDAHGNAVPGKAVALDPSGGHSSVSTAQIPVEESGCPAPEAAGTTDCNGRARFRVTDADVENLSYSATVSGVDVTIADTASISFDAGPPSASGSTVTAAPSSRLADGNATAYVTVTVKDGGDHVLPDEPVAVGQGSTSATIGSVPIPVEDSACPSATPAGRTDCRGKAKFAVTDSTVETVTHSASVGIGAAQVRLDDMPTVDFTATPDRDRSTLTLSAPSPLPADGNTEADITAHLRDSAGFGIPGKTVSLSPSPTGSAVSPTTAVTDADGNALFHVTSTTAGTYAYQLSDDTDYPDGPLLSTSLIATFTPVPTEAGQSTVTASPVRVPAIDGQSSTVTVQLRDAQNEPVSGHGVTLAADGNAAVTGSPATTDANGEATFGVSDTTVEAVNVEATDTTTGAEIIQTATISFIADEAAVSTFTASPDTAIANGGATDEGKSYLTVTLDPEHPLVGNQVVLSKSSGTKASIKGVPSTGSCPAPAGVTDCAGQAHFVVTDSTPETVTITAFDSATGTTVAQTVSVRFKVDAPIVSSLDPDRGTVAGGTVVTITGAGFVTAAGATQVEFGTAPGTAVKCTSTTSCKVTSPAASSPGDVDVTVSIPGADSSVATSDDTFTYTRIPPTISAVSPSKGSVAGGTLVTITGSHLEGATEVLFGTAHVPVPVQSVSGSTVTAVTPAELAGTVNVQVRTPGGLSEITHAARFTFARAVHNHTAIEASQRAHLVAASIN